MSYPNVQNPHQNLNERQKSAVITAEGPLLILAGAGAGKTKTVTHRILELIRNGTAPHQILAITFTNKAAKEMRERVEHLLSSDSGLNRPISMAERPFVSTFHALGVHIIKENCSRLGIPRHFTIFDRSDSKRAVKEAVESSQLDPKQFDPGAMLNAISRKKGDGMTLVDFKNAARSGGAGGYYEQVIGQVWEKYEAALAKERALDFDDLLLKTAVLLKNDATVRTHYQKIWKYIHVDEYQDTNKVQYMIATSLAEAHRNICVVGDIDQMIYSWRGADIQNILNFEKDYPEAKIVLLEENYRSTQTILAAANNVIKKNRLRREKNLFTKNSEGDKIDLAVSYTEDEEARTIAEKVRTLIEKGAGPGSKPVDPREIAILYRANFQSRIIEEAFLKKNIPYQVLGTRFFDRKEVRDVISFIKASLNRDSVGDLVRIVNVPPRGIGKTTILKVIEAHIAGKEPALGPALMSKVSQFLNLLERIKHTAMTQPPSVLMKYIIRESGMETAYRNGTAEDQEKLENLRELASVAAQYDAIALGGETAEQGQTGYEAAIEALLTNTALATDQDELQKDHNAVKLMTVHASKGLEFDYVFVAGMEEDLFPHKRLDEAEVSESEAEEERRLFYVALTRARKKVFLSYAQLRTIYGSQKVNVPSEFISDIGNEHIESEVVEEARGVKAIFIDF